MSFLASLVGNIQNWQPVCSASLVHQVHDAVNILSTELAHGYIAETHWLWFNDDCVTLLWVRTHQTRITSLNKSLCSVRHPMSQFGGTPGHVPIIQFEKKNISHCTSKAKADAQIGKIDNHSQIIVPCQYATLLIQIVPCNQSIHNYFLLIQVGSLT
jgi:hypothetical protein